MIEIIPAIDIIDGRCVRLSQGDYDQQKTYHEDPVAVAKDFERRGFRRLHLVDLDGARSGKVVNEKTLQEICRQTSLQVDFSGGISSETDVQRALEAGAAFISVGSIAVRQPEVFKSWIARFGAGKFLLGADVKDGVVVVRGWTESTKLDVFALIDDYVSTGISQVVCTDVSKDGMLAGPSFQLYEEILQSFPGLKLVASGGVSSISDIEKLEEIGCTGVIIGKAFYEGKLKPEELKRYVD
jgi:phosphoribosylformimino-5-aminoimidazole carboxamide ribotide isomerase